MDLNAINFPLEEESKSSMREWILKTFKRRECIKFVQCKSYSEKCACGKKADEHIHGQQSQNVYSQTWKIQTHTALFPTNAFGTLEFQVADALTTKAEYIRLSFDTKPQHIIKLLKSYWQLELPKLIISIHGGIANFSIQPKLKQAIERGLTKVANTSKIWIITAGTDTGVVKHVGDILRNHFPKSKNNIVAIGIAPWGVVNGRNSLIGCGSEIPYYSNRQLLLPSGSLADLNNCHTYFLLVDDGTVGKYGCEISFRRRLERFLSRHKSEISMAFDLSKPKLLDVTVEEKITLQNHHAIPLVCLVIEGGTNTIQSVLVNVQDKPPVPVVVCDGSGRAADLLAFTHKYSHTINKKVEMEDDIKEQLVSTIMKTFGYNKEQAENIFVELMNCVSNKDYISIYKLGEDGQEIDVAILTASLKIADLQLSKQFDLIMSWNRPDIAKNYILLVGDPSEKQILEEKMFDALSQDKVEFVKLLLEYGVNLQNFLTIKRLQDLYNCKKGPANTLLLIVKDVVKKMDANYQISLLDIGLVVEKLMGSGYVSDYSKRDFKLKYIKFLERKFNILPADAINQDLEGFKYPYNELLIWAVLMKRHKMAMFVCKRDEETLAKSLVATKLNKALAREAELDDLDSEISDEFKKYAEEFATLAYGLLDRCYKEDDILTNQLLTYDLVNWSHWTCLNLAVAASLKDFLSHTSCQMLLSDLWMGGMKIRKYVTYKVITALLFPPTIFAIQFKSAKELQYMPQTQEEHEQELDDTSSISSGSSISDLDDFHLPNIVSSDKTAKESADYNAYLKYYSSIRQMQDHELTKKNGSLNNLEQVIDLNEDHNNNHDLSEQTKPLFNSEQKTDLETAFITQHEQIFKKPYQQDERKTVNFSVKARAKKLRFGKKIYEFYNAPITKFWQHVILYVIFLMCFTYMILVKTPPKPDAVEIFVLIYIFTFGLDKIRELLQGDSPRFSGKLKVFFSRIMNTTDCIFILTTMIALPFRLSGDLKHRITARLFYCVNSIYWYVKILEFLIINKYAGPLIIIAARMMVDLFNFVIVLLVVLMSFGVSRQAIKYPNLDFSWVSVKQIFIEPYFMLYGEVYADTIDPVCTEEDLAKAEPQCQPGHWITPLTMTAFLIVANFLLLTILIASFNTTYLRINRISGQVWKFQRFSFVSKYEGKPLFAPPFVVISHIYMVIKYLVRYCQGKKLKFDRKLKSFLSDEMIQRLHDFEERVFYEYDHDLKLAEKEKMEEKVTTTTNRVENISTRIDDIFAKENMTKLSLYKVESRLQKLEEFTFDMVEQLQQLTNQIKLGSIRNSIDYRHDKDEILDIDEQIQNINNSNNNNLSDSKLALNNLTLMKTRPSLRRRMNSESSARHTGEGDNSSDFKYLRQCSLRNKTLISPQNSIELNKTKDDSLNKVNIIDEAKANEPEATKTRPMFTIDDVSDSHRNSIHTEADLLPTENQMLIANPVNPLTKQNSGSKLNNNELLSKIQSQQSTCLDQYTLHQFVYLQPVVKPPLNEYTSITDCIDTSDLDRAPSPPPSFLSSSIGAYPVDAQLSINRNISDYCQTESVRSAIARQESEMLRLAEESQHVIITQMLNKMVKVASKVDKARNSLSKNKIAFKTDNSEMTTSDEAAKISDAEVFDIEIESEKISDNDNLTDENKDNVSSLAAGLNKKVVTTHGRKLERGKTILDEKHRNSSQIWYVQSEADALCLDLEEDENAS